MAQCEMLVNNPVQVRIEMKEAAVRALIETLERRVAGRTCTFPGRQKDETVGVRNDQRKHSNWMEKRTRRAFKSFGISHRKTRDGFGKNVKPRAA